MKTSVLFIETAKAKLDWENAKDEAMLYAGCKSLKDLKKDSKFIELCNDVKMTRKIYCDYSIVALTQKRKEDRLIRTLMN